MDIFIGIALFVAAIFLILVLYAINEQDGEISGVIPSAVIGALIIVFIIGGIDILDKGCNPPITPMDVYQGKTTLKYEIVNGVKVDSCVIWKKE